MLFRHLGVFCTALLFFASHTSAMMRCEEYNQAKGIGAWHCPTNLTDIYFVDTNLLYIPSPATKEHGDFTGYQLNLTNNTFGPTKTSYIKQQTQQNEYSVAISRQEIVVRKNGFTDVCSFKRTPENNELIPDEWYKAAALSNDACKLAIITTKNNVIVLDISDVTNEQNISQPTNRRTQGQQETSIPNIAASSTESQQRSVATQITNSTARNNIPQQQSIRIEPNPQTEYLWQRCWEKVCKNLKTSLLIATITGIASYFAYKKLKPKLASWEWFKKWKIK